MSAVSNKPVNMKEGDHRPQPNQPQPSRESGQPPGGLRAWWRESRLRKLISRQSPPQEITPINEVQHQQQSAANTLAPHSPDEPSRGQVPGEEVHQVFDKRKSLRTLVEEGRKLFSETDRREMRRFGRPINLHDTPFEKKLRSLIIETVEKMASPDTIEEMEFVEEVRDRKLRENDIEVQTSSSLTPDQQERFRIIENMVVLDSLKTIPMKIQYVEEYLNEEERDKLQQLNPELMNPIIRGLEKRPARRKKAEAAIQRIYDRRGEENPGKPLILIEYNALRILAPSIFPTE